MHRFGQGFFPFSFRHGPLGLYHLEAFPIDVWIKRALKENFPKDFDPATLGEYAGLAQQYIFYYARSHGK